MINVPSFPSKKRMDAKITGADPCLCYLKFACEEQNRLPARHIQQSHLTGLSLADAIGLPQVNRKLRIWAGLKLY
jgi:hypothetical protein